MQGLIFFLRGGSWEAVPSSAKTTEPLSFVPRDARRLHEAISPGRRYYSGSAVIQPTTRDRLNATQRPSGTR